MSETELLLDKKNINHLEKWVVFVKHYEVDEGFKMHGPFKSLPQATQYVEERGWNTEAFIAEVHRKTSLEMVKEYTHTDMVK